MGLINSMDKTEKLSCLFMVIFWLATSLITYVIKPDTVSLDSVTYEKVQAQVMDIQVKEIYRVRGAHEERYYFTLKVKDNEYKWIARYNPGLKIGKREPFYLSDGRIYHTEKEIIDTLTYNNGSIFYKMFNFVSQASLPLTIIMPFLIWKAKQQKPIHKSEFSNQIRF